MLQSPVREWPVHERTIPPVIHEEEEEEEEDEEEDETLYYEHDEDYYEEEAYMLPTDATFELATRTFYATMQKFARRRYSFLESWHLHSMYSKSQQILLGLPQPQPVVFLSGDDMMYTPPLVQPQQHYPPNDVDDYEHENHPDYYYDDDDHWHDEYKADQLLTEDEGVLVMTAPSPEEPRRVLDETMWMSRKDEFKEDEMEEEERNEEAMAPVGIPPDLVDWYRAGNNQRRPPTIMDSSEPAVHGETTQAEKQDEKQDDGMADASATSYQSLADIMPTTKTTRSAPGVTQALSYGSTTMQAKTKIMTWPDMITTTLLRLADWADDMPLENAWDAIVCVVRIWYMLFVCAELMLHHAYSGRRLEQPAEEDRRWLDHMV